MRKFRVKAETLLNDASVLKTGVAFSSQITAQVNPKILSRRDCDDDGLVVYKPDGTVLFMWVLNVIPESVWRPAYELLRTVSGTLANRPGIVGENLRMPRIRKDGTASRFNALPIAITDKLSGKQDMLGYYRYKNPRPGVPQCDLTGWTLRDPEIYGGIREFIMAVDETYRLFMPAEYATQKAYLDKVPSQWKIAGTNFTTLYVLKNHPTAIHTDDFDQEGSFGVMATLGDWEGNEIVWPKFRVGCDYRPGDLLFGDVHEFHGNLPKLSGDRVSCVFFVRTGMHECPSKG
jgi:hypothetical protein